LNYIYREFTDLGDVQGYSTRATFKPIKVRNKVQVVYSDQQWSLNLIPGKSPSSFSDLKVSCWSKSCPTFFHYSPETFTVWTDFRTTNVVLKNSTYIYFAEYTKLAKN